MIMNTQLVRAYAIRNGDVFTIEDKRIIEVLSQSNSHHIFLPLRRYKKVTWYRPWTWFRWFWKVQYIEYGEEAESNAGDLAET